MNHEILKGIAASSGQAAGKVRIIEPGADRTQFQNGEVLVTRLTDPSMIAMMAKASAIITEVGGLTSHPAIVSREMGTPCVTSAKNATTVLQNGMTVLVDGNSGLVHLIEE